MSKRFDNKRLLFLLSGLVVLLGLTIFIKIPKEKATLKRKFVDLDSSQVSKILFYPGIDTADSFEFLSNNGKWNVRHRNIISASQAGAIPNILNEVINLKPKSLVSVSKSKWNEFGLTDSLGTRIKFLDKKGRSLADLMIGKFNYKPSENPYGGNGGNNIDITSYVRDYNEKEVYAVDGMISYYSKLKFDDWRDRTFIKSTANDILNIRFQYPSDSSYSLNKKGKVWEVGDLTADSTVVANYLATLVLLNGETFKDNFRPPLDPPAYQVSIEGNNLLNISVKCYKGEGIDEYIMNSSLSPEVYFTTRKKDLFDKVFKPKNTFFKTKGKVIKKES